MIAHSCLYSEMIVRMVFYKLLTSSGLLEGRKYNSAYNSSWGCWGTVGTLPAGYRGLSGGRSDPGLRLHAPHQEVSLKCGFIGSWRIEPKLKTRSRTASSTRLSSRQFAVVAPHRT